jgi:hypothetical protein
MIDQNYTSDAASIKFDPKSFLTIEQLLEVWDTRGMKYRVDELHQLLLNRGLVPYADRGIFRKMFFEILETFLVKGLAKRDPRSTPAPRFPKVL